LVELLQWGRDQLIAEIITVKSLGSAKGRLQWSRDQVPENAFVGVGLALWGFKLQ